MKHLFEIKVLAGVHGGARAALRDGRVVIGSAEDCDIVLSDEDVAGHHAALTVDGDGVTVSPLDGEVMREDGTLVGDGEVLPAYTPIGIGASIVAVGQADASWPRFDIAKFGRSRPGDDNGRDGEADSAPDAPSPPAARAKSATGGPAVKKSPQGGSKAAGKRIRSASLYPVAVLLLVGIGFIAFSWFSDSSAVQPEESAEVPREVAQDSVVDEIRDALRAEGLASDVDIRELSPNSVLVTGYVELSEQKETLSRIVASTGVKAALRVWAQDELLAAARGRLSRFSSALDVESLGRGAVAVVGYLDDDASRERIASALREDIPGLRRVVDRLVSPQDLAQMLKDAVAASSIAGKVVVENDSGTVVARGSLGEGGLETWNAIVDGLAQAHGGSTPPIRTAFVPRADELPFAIRAVVSGPMRYALTDTGRRVAEGGQLGGGFAVQKIAEGEVTIEGRGQVFVQRFKE